MSRIAKKPIIIPEKTQVSVAGGVVTVKGPLGELNRGYKPVIEIKVENNEIFLIPKDESIETSALWGTYASHIKNMLAGVSKAYEKRLIVEGIGFKYDVKPKEMIFNLGFSHQIKLEIPAGLKITSDKTAMIISGIDKDSVGAFASKIRSLKKPEPYKGKGIHYEGEVIRRKQGKKAA
ncbi:MAG: 50S ribosomal protein L6 [Candidatus Taylorbacteria bacterium]|nr:50S ribosomal protein L6 [Candidatus Taylorbacteria bacterium]